MNRAQLEHVIRASTTICHDDEVIIIGSQAILGAIPDAPADLLVSMEADVLPKNAPERTIEIEPLIKTSSGAPSERLAATLAVVTASRQRDRHHIFLVHPTHPNYPTHGTN
jgi:hypothetical protein